MSFTIEEKKVFAGRMEDGFIANNLDLFSPLSYFTEILKGLTDGQKNTIDAQINKMFLLTNDISNHIEMFMFIKRHEKQILKAILSEVVK